MNIFWSIIFFIGTIYIGIFSGCSVKNIAPKDIKENTSDLKNKLSPNKSSSLEKSIEPEDKPSISCEETISEETMIYGSFRTPSTPNKHSNPFLDSDKLTEKLDLNKPTQKIIGTNFDTDGMINSVFFDYD